LGEYCKKNIFEPLGCSEINFGVRPDQKNRFVGQHARGTDGKLTARDHVPFHTMKPEYDSGGAGCTSTVGDYLKIVNVLINDGVGANGARIIKSETLKQMLTDQLGDLPQKDPLDQVIPDVRPDLTYEVRMLPGLKKGWVCDEPMSLFKELNVPFVGPKLLDCERSLAYWPSSRCSLVGWSGELILAS